MESAVSAVAGTMASAEVNEPPSKALEPSSVAATGDTTAEGDPNNLANNNTNATNASQDNSPAPVSENTSASASATASPSPDLPPRIVSDIQPAASLPQAAPAVAAAPPTSASVASPALSASPSVHSLGARPGLRSTSNTPHHSPALPSPPVPLRASPAASRPSPAATQPPPATAARASEYQNNTVWRAQPSPRVHRKLPISPAPRLAAASGSPAPLPPTGFPSPGRDRIHADPKFLDDKTRITFGIQQAIPEAVRRSVRDNWEKCLLGSEFHQAFVLNASIHHATQAAVQRGMRDFGRVMISSAKAEIVDAMTPADIDDVAARLLSKASDSFLDAALELRLKSIDAKRLINALARAERLGYEPSDVVGEEDDPAVTQPPIYHEPVMPNHVQAPQQPSVQPAPRQPRAHEAPPPGASTAPVMYCKLCFRKFVYQSAYEHHVEKKVCTRSPVAPGGYKFSCQHCGQGFTTIMGVQYHNANNICGTFTDPYRLTPAPAASVPTTPKPTHHAPMTPSSAPTSTPILLPTPTPAPASLQATATPTSSGNGPRKGTPGLHTPHGAVADPYAHLSPEQLAAMQEELRLAELSYAERFRQANAIPDAAERKTRLDGLSNSFGTKQSLIRKKYGVRLRMRRTKAEIQAERDRMQYKTAAELAADIGIPSPNLGRPGRPIASTPARPPAVIARSSNGGTGANWSSVNRPGASTGAPAPQAPMGTAASAPPVYESTAGGHSITDHSELNSGFKRRFSGSGPSSESKRVAYSEMGGLSGGAAAHAETVDPTLPPGAGARAGSTVNAKGQGTFDEPMALGDTESESEDSGEDDDDIPAELPPSVRQSLQQASPSVTPGPQPGSRPSSGLRSEDPK